MPTTKYYGNQQCEVITEIGEEVVIELLIGEVELEGAEYDEPAYVEPYHTKIIVDKRHLSDVPLTSMDIIAEKDRAIREAAKEIAAMRRTANSGIYDQKRDAEKELKEVRARVERFEGMNQYMDLLDGKYEYVIYADCEYSYRCGIRKLSELMCGCSSDELASVSFRAKKQNERRGKSAMYLSQYSDDSGSSKYSILGFYTYDDAKKAFADQLATGNRPLSDRVVAECEKHGIELDVVTEFKEEQKRKEEKSRQQSIAQMKKELAELEDGN